MDICTFARQERPLFVWLLFSYDLMGNQVQRDGYPGAVAWAADGVCWGLAESE